MDVPIQFRRLSERRGKADLRSNSVSNSRSMERTAAKFSSGPLSWSGAEMLGPHFSLAEMTRSATAQKHKINNHPVELHEYENLKALTQRVLEPARQIIGRPLLITSGYRSSTLNRILGGARQSQHMLGEAADFIVKGADMFEVAQSLTALESIPFDQLIFENRLNRGMMKRLKDGFGGRVDKRQGTDTIKGLSGGLLNDYKWTQWIHVSHRRLWENRGEVLTIVHDETGRKVTQGIIPPEAVLAAP